MKTLKTLGFSSLLAACVAVGGDATAQPYQKADDVQDMALIYQGGSHRLDWTADEFRPYVVHRFADGTKDWLFDGFLFLEFKNGSGRHYTVGYEKLNARASGHGSSTASSRRASRSRRSISASRRRSPSWANPVSSTRSCWDFPRPSATRRTGAS